MLSSCKRLGFPTFDPKELKQLIKELLRLDSNYLPTNPGGCLYIRPTAMSMTNTLGVKMADKVKLFVILSPVKEYFSGDIHLGVCESYARGSQNSANAYKLGANYAPTVAISGEYGKQGMNQVIWLNEGNILESGATNIFFIQEEIVNGWFINSYKFYDFFLLLNFLFIVYLILLDKIEFIKKILSLIPFTHNYNFT